MTRKQLCILTKQPCRIELCTSNAPNPGMPGTPAMPCSPGGPNLPGTPGGPAGQSFCGMQSNL